MRRTWLLAFLFLTLWQMFPHEGYNMLYAQGMGDESYGGGYNCDDDDGYGAYSSSLPCDETPCVTPCPACHVTYACDEIAYHTCPADNITCSFCGESMTPEQYQNHTCSNQNEDGHCLICGRTIDQCSCEGAVITPNNPSVTPSNPSPGGDTGTNNSSSNSSSNNSSTNNTPSKSNVTEEKLINYFKSSIYNRTYSSKTCGYCLRGWKTIWQKAGIGEYDGTRLAKDFGTVLIKYGFKVIYSGNCNQCPSNYTPQIGDTRIWESYTGQPSQAGHIDWWNGTHWVSDYVQQRDWTPGRKYNGISYKIYR